MNNQKQKQIDHESLLRQLADCSMPAPEGFTRQVMQALPTTIPRRKLFHIQNWWPSHGSWMVPALAGAAAMLLIWFGVSFFNEQQIQDDHNVLVSFELHAPDAQTVELAGSFNNWQPGTIELKGPDASGHWTAEVRLPEGRHEYMFLVDGKEWIVDPDAVAYRDDGFGLQNAVLEL